MPMCHRCERVLASAELRRTTRGHLCKDNGKGSRCWSIARALRINRRAPHRLADYESERRAAASAG